MSENNYSAVMFRVLSTNQNIDALCKPNDSGIYFQPTNAGATTANGYPFPSAGVLKVYPCANNGVQQWYTAFDSNITAIRSVIGWNGNLAIWGDWEPQATKRQLDAAIAALIDSSPDELNTLGELAAAIGNDPNFATTMAAALGLKAPLDSPTLTGIPTGPTAAKTESSVQLATTAFVKAVVADYATKASPALTGAPTTPTAAKGDKSKQIANTEFANDLIDSLFDGRQGKRNLMVSAVWVGDSDSGIAGNGDGNVALVANNATVGYFSEDELQHGVKILAPFFRAIAKNNAWPGAGGLNNQRTTDAPFCTPNIIRPNDDNNYFPITKGKVSLASGYPVAASLGLLTTGNANFPQIVIHAGTDFEVNDKLWVFDVATGELRSPALIKAGEAVLNTNGDISGSAWGGALTNWLNSQLATRDANINARATVDWVNSNFNKKNSAQMGFSGWSRDESTGLLMQWGNVDNARGTYSFPRAFSDTCFAVFACNKDGQLGAIDNAYGYPVSKTQFYLSSKANSGSDTACGISWFALGY